MSGPKVVRVRTREEMAEECYQLIDALRAAIDQMESFARRHDATTAPNRVALLSELVKQVENGDFDKARHKCQVELATVAAEREQLEIEILRRASEQKDRRRRCQYMALSLMNHLRGSSSPIPAEIEAASKGQIGDSNESLQSVETAISRALQAHALKGVREDAGTFITTTQRRLAALLVDGDADRAVTSRSEGTHSSPAAVKRLDRAITEVRVLDESDQGRWLAERMQQAMDSPDALVDSMKIDSLLLEWSQRRARLKELANQRAQALQLKFVLDRMKEDSSTSPANRLLSAQENEIAGVLAEAQNFIGMKARETNASRRRAALLSGLATLGYEVGSELSSVWNRQGRLVVKKPDRPGYGVEISGPPEAGQLQVRVVSFGDAHGPRDESRDRDAETMWCSEFSELQRLTATEGNSIEIVRALGVGTVPVSRVALTESDQPQDAESRSDQSLSLR